MEFTLPSEIQTTIFSFASDLNLALCDTQTLSIFNYLKEKALKGPEKVILNKSPFYRVLKPITELMKLAIKVGVVEAVEKWSSMDLISDNEGMCEAAKGGHLELVKF